MSKYAYIVAANHKYLPGLNALLNSLDYVKNTHDVYIISYKLPDAYIKAVENAGFPFRVIWDEASQKEIDWLGEGEVLMRKRYLIPAITDYDAVCLLDADMFICQELTRYFIAAEAGLILGCGMEQKRMYNTRNHEYPHGSGNYIIPPDRWAKRDLCCAPLFIGRRWFPTLRKVWDLSNDLPHETRIHAPEMDVQNIVLIAAGAEEWTIPMNQPCWTGLHESLMKAHTRAVDIRGMLFTEDGQEVNIVHGQYWNRIWRGWQIDGQMGMIKREFDDSTRYKQISQGSFEHICRWFRRFACEGKININDFPLVSKEPVTEVMEIT